MDLEKLRYAVVEASAEAFRLIQRNHVGERFYAFALYTVPLGDSLHPTANTEESLTRLAKRMVEPSPESHKDLGAEERELRWAASEWEYFEGEPYFSEVHKLLTQIAPSVEEAHLLHATYRKALKELDRRGIFGTGADRDRIVINLFWGDRDDSQFLEWARELNPKPAFERYRKDIEQLGWLPMPLPEAEDV
jgi:hypothetical protein